MFEDFGKRFFEVLQREAVTRLGRDHTRSLALSKAVETGKEADIQRAWKQLSALPDEVQEPLMKAVHSAMREDPAALLNMWGGSPPDRSN